MYQVSVKREDNDEIETYVGLTENNFKTRFNNHVNPKHKHATALIGIISGYEGREGRIFYYMENPEEMQA